MKKIHCNRSYDYDHTIGDWKSTDHLDEEGFRCYILCVKDTRKWWETDDADEIIVKISTYSTTSSYLCQLIRVTDKYGDRETRMRIQDEDTGRWKRYEIYGDLLEEIEDVIKKSGGNEGNYFYLGVDLP
jgi:hypothetical protein